MNKNDLNLVDIISANEDPEETFELLDLLGKDYIIHKISLQYKHLINIFYIFRSRYLWRSLQGLCKK